MSSAKHKGTLSNMSAQTFIQMLFIGVFTLILSACSHTGQDNSLYAKLGGQQKIEQIVDNFIIEIEYSPQIFPYFAKSDVQRFRAKLVEHLCMLTQGPCEYSGDTMKQVHAGMNITEHDFNLAVDLFIQAMVKAEIPHTQQNQVLATMIPTRKDIIYQ
jgi:hemoglobin